MVETPFNAKIEATFSWLFWGDYWIPDRLQGKGYPLERLQKTLQPAAATTTSVLAGS